MIQHLDTSNELRDRVRYLVESCREEMSSMKKSQQETMELVQTLTYAVIVLLIDHT